MQSYVGKELCLQMFNLRKIPFCLPSENWFKLHQNPDPYSFKMLDPDPHTINSDLKHCLLVRALAMQNCCKWRELRGNMLRPGSGQYVDLTFNLLYTGTVLCYKCSSFVFVR
jgi:hypothetical protein